MKQYPLKKTLNSQNPYASRLTFLTITTLTVAQFSGSSYPEQLTDVLLSTRKMHPYACAEQPAVKDSNKLRQAKTGVCAQTSI